MDDPYSKIPIGQLQSLIKEKQTARKQMQWTFAPLFVVALSMAYITAAMFFMELFIMAFPRLDPGVPTFGSVGELGVGTGLLSFAAVQWFSRADRESREDEQELIASVFRRLEDMEEEMDAGNENSNPGP